MKIAEGYVHSSRGEIPGPPPLNDSPGSTCINWPLYPASPTVQLCITKQILSFSLPIPHKNPLRNKQKTLLASGHKETWVTLLSALINTVLQGGCSVFDFLIFLNCYYIWSGSVGHLSFNFILIYQFRCRYIQAVCWWILFVFILLIFMSI